MKPPSERIDPELAEALRAIPRGPAGIYDLGDIPGTRGAVREQARAMAAQMPDDPSVSVEELEAPRQDGPGIPLRLLRPDKQGPLPALLWFHGGGQVLGYAAQEDPFLKRICAEVGCTVAAVDYRLAPEAPAPAAAEDGLLAYSWLRERAGGLGLDAERIGIAGASGGAGIAAATALMVRDRGAAKPFLLSLNYPMLDDRNDTLSSREITDIGIWDRRSNLLAWQAILGDAAGTAKVTSHQAAARATDLADLPPAFIAVGELDVFRDEDVRFATRLVEHGVPVELHLYPGAYHAWDLFAPESALTAAFYDAWHGWLRRQFARRG